MPESIGAYLKIALVLTAINEVLDLYVTFCCQRDCSSRQSGNSYLCLLCFINLPFIFSLRELDMCMFFSRQAIHTVMILHPAPCKISIIVSLILKLEPCFVLDKARKLPFDLGFCVPRWNENKWQRKACSDTESCVVIRENGALWSESVFVWREWRTLTYLS